MAEEAYLLRILPDPPHHPNSQLEVQVRGAALQVIDTLQDLFEDADKDRSGSLEAEELTELLCK